ncbi:ABC transporter G family member 14 [Citrus sinensis]|uniref:ABC transporter G family member 14 n=1 Tax=Citrus sinensis TaxID=2711 RepID=A0ACB8NH13_CITSI|nr:ABC transporter G family member 14 [Citrus sinensis]
MNLRRRTQKRVSRAQELLINPSLLFLDEPASGLDSTIAKQILLNSEGNSLHVGKGDGVMSYFVGIGFEPSAAMNPSDFLLDLANGVVSGDPKDDQKALKETLISAYKSNLSEKLKASFQEVGDHSLIGPGNKKNSNWSTTWLDSFSSTADLQDIGFISSYSYKSSGANDAWNRLSSYFVAKTIGDLPMELTLPTVFVVVTYWMARIKSTTVNFLCTLSITLCTALVDQASKYKTCNWCRVDETEGFCCRLNTRLMILVFVACLVGDFPRIKYAGLSHQIICVAALAVMLLGSRLAAYDALMGIGRISH